MNHLKTTTLTAAALAACTASFADRAAAQEPTAEFAAPVRIRAGDDQAGKGRLYPSPAFHDVDGDGRVDLVIGDLPGRVTVALRTADDAAVTFGPEQPLKDRRGEQLKFHNW